jgi:hypothetical protein
MPQTALGPHLGTTTLSVHLPGYMILPYGRAMKSDLQKISLSAVSTDGLYFSTNVTAILINKAEQKPIRLADFENHISTVGSSSLASDEQILDYMCDALKAHNPNMTPYEQMFLELYFGLLKVFRTDYRRDNWKVATEARRQIGLRYDVAGYDSITDVWRALLPIPELQLYVRDPLSDWESYQPNNNLRVDYGFWDGKRLIAVEIDGAEPAGYARDIRRDRLLKKAGVTVIHILNIELMKHQSLALLKSLPRYFFGFDWNYKSERPEFEIPF